MAQQDRLIATSGLMVTIGIVANRLFLLAVLVGLLISWIFTRGLSRFLAQSTPGVDAAARLLGLRWELLIGIVMAIATDRLLVSLGGMTTTARAGDPFVGSNAHRLHVIGWSLLVLQLLDIAGMLLDRLIPSLGSAAPDTGFSVGGWIAVLMVFVLGRVFAAGATMRDELEGTI